MPYTNTTTNTFGHTIYDVRAANPETSIPEGASFGDFEWYAPTAPQAYNPRTHVAVEIAPTNGVQQWRVEPTKPAPIQMSSLAFLDLFTESEQIAVASAAMSNVQAKLWYDRTLAAEFVTLADPRTEAGLTALTDIGLLSKERKAVIIASMLN